MKLTALLIFIITTIVTTHASDEFCFTGLSSHEGLRVNKINKAMSCEKRDSLVTALQAGTLSIGTITAICTWAPDPGLTKVSAALLATGGLVLNYATFLVRRLPCNSSAKRELNDYERTEFLEKMCQAIDKRYNPYTEKCN